MALILKRVGRYELLKEIGRGGMATVYLARQTDLDRFVALKELATLHSADEAFAERFLRESRMAGSLSHPNIVTVHDYFEHEGTPYISMEYLERGSLRPLVGKLTFAQVCGVLEGLLAGLQHASSRGIVHRDMKPENVMITGEGGVKISDFGIGRALNQAGQASRFLTATGTAIGTPAYMAPEQAMAKEVGPWTDLYSLGIMAYEMVLGEVPFSDSDTPMSMLVRHVSEPIPAPATVDPSVDPQLSEWLECLLKKDPKERPADGQEAWDGLEEIVIHLLGPRWRREARLPEEGAPADEEARPLTPAPFSEERSQVSTATPEPEYLTVNPAVGLDAPPVAEAAAPVAEPPPPPPAPAVDLPGEGEQEDVYLTFAPGGQKAPPSPRRPGDPRTPCGGARGRRCLPHLRAGRGARTGARAGSRSSCGPGARARAGTGTGTGTLEGRRGDRSRPRRSRRRGRPAQAEARPRQVQETAAAAAAERPADPEPPPGGAGDGPGRRRRDRRGERRAGRRPGRAARTDRRRGAPRAVAGGRCARRRGAGDGRRHARGSPERA